MLGDALGDQLDYYSELLDRYHFPDPSYESDFEDYLVRKYADRRIKLLIANGPDEAALAGRLQARLAVSTADRVRRPRCAAASSEIDRPYVSVAIERVAGFGAAGASRHPSRVRRARRISAGCTERSRVSLSGARAAARRGVHLLARRLAACVDRPAGGAAGALHCLSGHGPVRWRRPAVSDSIGVGAPGGGEQRADLHVERQFSGRFRRSVAFRRTGRQKDERTRTARVARRATRGHSDHRPST